MRVARPQRTFRVFVLVLAAIAASVADVRADAALDRIAAARARGVLDEADAAFLALQRFFEPEALPPEFAPATDEPLRCGTAIVREAVLHLDAMNPERRALATRWIESSNARRRRAVTYLSPSGNFELGYETSGPDSVPITDVAPMNGIPDFVERVATYLDTAWSVEIDQLGFVAPDVASEPYPVSFAEIGGFGYATDGNAGAAGTRIVLHRNFEGFRANDDPEGSVWGAAKVTCAHELKHAIQFATSGWSEPGLWVELDATWVEDLVFDQVNDYIAYYSSSSPISAPQLPLDAGGSGSYPENCFQHWMSESYGTGIVLDFWNRRAAMPAEAVLDSYDAALGLHGASLLEDFVVFAAWNQQTGTRAKPGFGYSEAAAFPDAPIAAQSSSVPAQFSSVVEHLAAKTMSVSGFAGPAGGVVDIRVVRDTNSPVRAAVIVHETVGDRFVQVLDLKSTDDTVTLPIASSFVQSIDVVVANGDPLSGPAQYTVIVDERVDLPDPLPVVTASTASIDVPAGGSGSFVVDLRNEQPGSTPLDYEAYVVEPIPASRARDIGGSTLSVDFDTYTPGAQLARGFLVRNGGTSFEWLSEVHLTVPSGVSVVSSTNMVSEANQTLVTSGATGEAITLSWFDPDGLWGQVMAGETALASVTLLFDLSLVGDVVLDYRIVGDGFGTAPHEVTGTIVLRGPSNPFVDVFLPDGGEVVMQGEPTEVAWVAASTADVALDLSRDGGSNWETIVASTPNDSTYTWIPTGPASENCRLRVRAVGDTTQAAMSDAPFALLTRSGFATVSPDSGRIPSLTTAVLTVDVDAAQLAPGAYSALLYIVHNGAVSALRVPIDVNVAPTVTETGPLPERNRVVGVSPNPFNPATQVFLELAHESDVRIVIHDSRGRVVRRLFDRRLPGGTHGIPWDSRDDAGGSVASGTYYYVAEIDGERTTGKMLLLK